MKGLAALVSLLLTLSACAFEQNGLSRRAFVQVAAGTTAATLLGQSVQQPAFAAAPAALVEELKSSKIKMEPIPELLEQKEWDKVRSILKLPPVNKLWNLGDSQNTILQIAKETGNVDLFELKDDLAYNLQMCDQLTYDNAFVYYQPGNGKFKIKEPQELARKAMAQIQQAIDMANE